MGVTSVRLPDELQSRLEQTAERLRRPKGWVITEALTEFVAREERQARRLKKTQAALIQLDNDKVVDGDAVMDWLSSWGSENEKRAPDS